VKETPDDGGGEQRPAPWYFCQRCNNCCRWPGTVKVSGEEVDRIASYLGMDAGRFIEEYAELRPDRLGLTIKSRENHECMMFDGVGCRIHEVKPAQCKGFPNRWNFPGWRSVCEAVEAMG